MDETVIPNLFIVGAPKSGTTSLYQYLSEHENVFFPAMKEPHFFTLDRPERRRVKSLKEYLALYRDVKPMHTIVGDASVSYLNSPTALSEIKRFNPAAKIIVMLRNPVDMIISQHAQLLYTLDENIPDFMEAYSLQLDRSKGKRIPPQCREPLKLQYYERAKLGSQVNKLAKIFPRHQIKYILFDKFKSNTSETYSEILDFLGIQNDNRKSFDNYNPRTENKSYFLARIIKREPPAIVSSAVSILKKTFGVKIGIRTIIDKKNTTVKRTKELSNGDRNRIIAEFKEEVQLLSNIIEKDLSHWL